MTNQDGIPIFAKAHSGNASDKNTIMDSFLKVKKEERIEALAMIMVLTLMIYSIAEWLIRKRMRDTGETVPNQLKKPTQRPTFKWIAFLFMGVAEVTIWFNGEVHLSIANLNDNLVKIIRLLGPGCEKYYALER